MAELLGRLDLAGCERRWVQPQVQNQFFRGAGYATKICVSRIGIGIRHNDLLRLLYFRATRYFRFILTIGHDRFLQSGVIKNRPELISRTQSCVVGGTYSNAAL